MLAGLAAAQGAAFLVYRSVEGAREKGRAERTGFESEVLSGAEAPELMLLRRDGTRMSLSSLRGRPVLLHFWASWCRPCAEELPGLLAFAREVGPEGLAVIAVSLDEEWAPVDAFFEGETPPEVARGAWEEARELFGVETLPNTFLVGPDGRLERRMRGARDWRSPQTRRLIDERGGMR